MSELFLKIINMSIAASWLVLAVLILRFVLKKAPRWINVLLWGIVAIRLICPFSFESTLSLIPSAETIPLNIGMDTTPTINSGINAINNAVNPIISQSNTPMVGASANPLQITLFICTYIWIIGMVILALYTAVSYWRLRRKVDTAVRYKGSIFQSENVSSPFVLGIIKPRIYLPFHMNGQNLEHVVAHEQAHIRRKDHWWKPLGFLLLTIHWFNPLMWLAYVLLCRDIELACDEKVIKKLGNAQRADYTQALVECSVNRRIIAACPLAFGEVGVKERVKSVMNYKKPAFWIILLAIITCAVVAVCFLTNPAGTVLSKWTIDEVDMPTALRDVRSMTVQYNSEVVSCNDGDSSRFIATMDKIRVGRNPVSQSREEARDRSLTITINDNLHLHFSFDFSEIWADNGVKPSFSYPVTNPETAKELMLDFRFTHKGAVTRWFDYTENPSAMDNESTINLPVYPNVTFSYNQTQIIASKPFDTSELTGHTILITGMPIWNAYFTDLTGDGYPEICSTCNFGFGMIDNRITIYDYVNGVSYELSDRGNFDFVLRFHEADGYLYVDKMKYNTDELVESGRLVLKDNCLQVEGFSSNTDQSAETWDLIPMVMVNGTLYLDTGHESNAEARCGVMDGEITSQVARSKQPTADDQSNFGTGYGYQYGATEGTIEINIDGTWWIFATEEARHKIQFPSTEEASRFYLTIGAEGVKRICLSMPDSSGGCENADGSLFKKGERIWLESLDGCADLRGLTVTALDENGEIIWTASIPDEDESRGFTHLVTDDWEITNTG